MNLLKTTALTLSLTVLPASGAFAGNSNAVIVATDAYSWHGDTITQGAFKAFAPSDTSILSDYSAQPGYYMPIEKSWSVKNDISSYPRLKSSFRLHNAIYNMGLDEMINAVEPDTTLRTGKAWAGVWTRDVSYSIILSMAYMQPEASMISLMKKVDPDKRIIQDTGSGGAWPVSSDRMIWAVAAYEIYKVTGDRQWLETIYPIIRRSVTDDSNVVYDPATGLMHGETSFIDWRQQSYPKWMQTADIYASEALNTSIVHAEALKVLSRISAEMGNQDEAALYETKAADLVKAINKHFWMPDKGYYGMYLYGRNFPILNPRAETLGESLAILFDVASPERAAIITENNPLTPYGAAIFFPQIKDMPSYHNNALWPFVASFWTLANAKAGNEQGTLQGIGSVFRPAALFATNKENFNLDNGDIATELNSSNMLWSLAGNLAITYRVLFGIHFEENGLMFRPFVPKPLADTRVLEGFRYRNATLNITVKGFGDSIKSFKLNGKEHQPLLPPTISGHNEIVIVLADNDIPPLRVNNTANVKAPLTPIAWIDNNPALDIAGAPVNNFFRWEPVEYCDHYLVLRNGEPVTETYETSYAATVPGEYQVIAVESDGTQSFASRPCPNFPTVVFQVPAENTVISSTEISYPPVRPVTGFTGDGFVETDHSSTAIEIPVKVDADGTYAVSFRYANGNGPISTENKCAIRTILVDGIPVGTVVMPHRGEGKWNDWGMSNSIRVALSAGRHVVTMELNPSDENMNRKTNHALVDAVTVERLD